MIMPIAEAACLVEKGQISRDHLLAVVAYATENSNVISLVDCLPFAPDWVVKKALAKVGFEGPLELTTDEVLTFVAQLYAQAQQNQKTQQAAQTQQDPTAQSFMKGLEVASKYPFFAQDPKQRRTPKTSSTS